jgi:acetyltransferase-like isoleucine patch superfamily enzyme
MEEESVQADAKRVLLEKCMRGEFALTEARHPKVEEAAAAPPVSPHAAEADEPNPAAHAARPSLPLSSSSKMQVASDSKSKHKSVVRQAFNRFLHLLCRFGPGGTTLRPLFHRMRGVKIGKNVWIGDDVYLDNEFPECVELEDGAMIELRATILAHTHGAGRVIIGKNAFIGAGAVIVTSGHRTLVIGEGAVIMASSLVTGSIAPYTLYGSDASKPLARITKPFTANTSYEEFMTALRPLSR